MPTLSIGIVAGKSSREDDPSILMKEYMPPPIPEIDREGVDKLRKEAWAGSAKDGVQNSVEINDTGSSKKGSRVHTVQVRRTKDLGSKIRRPVIRGRRGLSEVLGKTQRNVLRKSLT